MKTLLVAICHPQAQELVSITSQTWSKGGADILCVDHYGKPPMNWSCPVTYHASIGTDREATRFGPVDRTLDVMAWCIQEFLREPPWDYDQFCFIEPDVVILREIPSCLDGVGGPCLLGTLAGGQSPPYIAKEYFHCPWVVPATKLPTLFGRGGRLVELGLGENGWTDRWLGLIAALYPELEMYDSGNYSQNALDQPRFIAEAREAMKRPDCFAIHGVKSKAQFDALML